MENFKVGDYVKVTGYPIRERADKIKEIKNGLIVLEKAAACFDVDTGMFADQLYGDIHIKKISKEELDKLNKEEYVYELAIDVKDFLETKLSLLTLNTNKFGRILEDFYSLIHSDY